MSLRTFGVLFVLAAIAYSQHRVDPRYTYDRVVCVVPFVGTGTPADPRRPEYAPWPITANQNGIIAFSFVPSDDGKHAVVEFVAQNRAAFQTIFNDKTIVVFEKGRSTKSAIETALQQYRKDFSLDKYGMVMP